MFNVKASPAKIRAGLLWLEYYVLTPGQGQLNYQREGRCGRTVGLLEQVGQGDLGGRCTGWWTWSVSSLNSWSSVPMSACTCSVTHCEVGGAGEAAAVA